MILQGGPADGREISPTPRDSFAWVDIGPQGELVVFDLNRPEHEQFPDRRQRGGWQEYARDLDNPGVYRWNRVTPRNRS